MSRPHGKYSSYTGGCRCDDCRRAASEYHRRRREDRRAASLAEMPVTVSGTHGLRSTYTRGCRCDACREANRAYYHARKLGRVCGPYELPTVNEGDVRWHAEAACRGMDTNVFFPAGGSGSRINWSAALTVCARCPVREACLDYAVRTSQPDGVWGGATPAERHRLRARRRRVAS